MPDDMTSLRWNRKPTAAQPLMGVTILAVEDSRFASEALRLVCMRSGARLRRADCLASARRHLSVYRPTLVMVDLGLPDGCGTELIAELAADVEPPIILAMSGEDDAESRAAAAGADGFLAKPLPGLAGFQTEILSHLPQDARPFGPRPVQSSAMEPDNMAFQDDLKRAAAALDDAGRCQRASAYTAQFLASVAQSAQDQPLAEAADRFARSAAAGHDVDLARGHLRSAVAARLTDARVI